MVFFSIQQENPSVRKWRDKTSNYVSKFICINIHSITSELWGNGIAKPEANSVSDLGALIFHDIFMIIWFSKLLFIHPAELAIHASVKKLFRFICCVNLRGNLSAKKKNTVSVESKTFFFNSLLKSSPAFAVLYQNSAINSYVEKRKVLLSTKI